MIKVEVHAARKEYRCHSCGRRILIRAVYTLESFPSPEKWAPPNTWVNRRFCSACRPLPDDRPQSTSCPAVVHGDPCTLTAGHHPATPHEFSIGLF